MLRRKDEPGRKWYPNSVDQLTEHFSQLIKACPDMGWPRCNSLTKNLVYSLQYLEFLDQVHRGLKLSEVVWKQNIKTFLIVGSSVIEGLFYFLLVADGKANKTIWKSSAKVESSTFALESKDRKLVSEVFLKLNTPELEEMSFDAMCKKVEKRDLARLTSDEFYKHLPHLRRLRNRVHIHTGEHSTDTDYFTFDDKDLKLMKKVLFLILTSDVFSLKNEKLWAFLISDGDILSVEA